MKELYRNVVRVLDDLPAKGVIYYREQGIELLGNSAEWNEVYKWICNNISANIIHPGSCSLVVVNPDGVSLHRKRLIEGIKQLKRAERSQKLADWNNLSGMLSNWITFLLALWGALSGTFAILSQIFDWI